ncbi:nitrile hydratase subunit beta, partial [Mycobacterium sp. ITM-2017-0098]
RTGAEGMNPFDYFKFRYYEKWLGGISQFFVDKGYVSEEEIGALLDVSDPPDGDAGDPAIDAQIIDYLRRGDSPRRDFAHPKF